MLQGTTCCLYPVAGNGDCGFLAALRISPPITPEHIERVRDLRTKIAAHASRTYGKEDLPTIFWRYDEALKASMSTLNIGPGGLERQLHELTAHEREQCEGAVLQEWMAYLHAVGTDQAQYETRNGVHVCIRSADRSGWYQAMALTRSAASVLQSDVCCLQTDFNGKNTTVYLAHPR